MIITIDDIYISWYHATQCYFDNVHTWFFCVKHELQQSWNWRQELYVVSVYVAWNKTWGCANFAVAIICCIMSCFLGCIEPCTFMLCLCVPIRLPNFRHQTEVACSKWSEPWQISRIQHVCWCLAIGTWHFSQTNLAKDKTIGIGTNNIHDF